jgi:hypothetical protein
MAMIDWIGWVLPALKLQLSWADKQSTVLCAIASEATPLRIGLHLSRLPTSAPATLAFSPSTSAAFGPARVVALPVPKPAMLNYEGSTLVDVGAAPLLDALTVDTSVEGRVAVRERTGDAVLCLLQTGGFDPTISGSEGNRQLGDLIAQASRRTPEDMEVIQGQAATVWPFVLAAGGRPFENRMATRTLLDVGLAVLHPLIAQAKHHLNVERPQSPQLTTAIAMPGHQSAPSGHAAVAYLLAGLLAPMQRATLSSERLFVAAASVATNRELAGVHFASDSQAGQALGLSLASWLTGLAVGRTALGAAFDLSGGALPAFAGFTAATSARPEWRWLYQRALAEWI